MIRRAVYCLLCLCFCFFSCAQGFESGTGAISEEEAVVYNNEIELTSGGYADTGGHESFEAIERWSGYGIVEGYGGFFRPDSEITRAEAAAIIVRLVGYSAYTETEFFDLPGDAWYFYDVSRLFSAGIMEGYAGYMRPNSPITREEAVTIIARAFDIPEIWSGGDFSDIGQAGDWAQGFIRSMSERGFLVCFGDSLFPKQNITRAEMVMIIDSMFKGFYNKPGVYSGAAYGNVIIRCPNVSLKNAWINGDVYIVEGVGDGWYTIDESAKIDGNVHVRAGRENPYPYIDPSAPMLAFTFDDGPSKTTDQILDILERYGARATFNVVGYLISSYKESLSRAVSLGNEIASHTWMHTSLTSMSDYAILKDLEDVSEAIFDAAGVRPRFVRPPYGNYNSFTNSVLGSAGISVLYWTVDPRDWSNRNAFTTYNNVMNGIKDGAIIGLHDSVPSTATAMEMLVPELIEQGYQLITATEMLTYSETGIEAGRVYISKYSIK